MTTRSAMVYRGDAAAAADDDDDDDDWGGKPTGPNHPRKLDTCNEHKHV
jgi:hypothetical protein